MTAGFSIPEAGATDELQLGVLTRKALDRHCSPVKELADAANQLVGKLLARLIADE